MYTIYDNRTGMTPSVNRAPRRLAATKKRYRRRLLMSLLLCLPVLCMFAGVSHAETNKETSRSLASLLRFGWPVPGKAKFKVTRLKRGNTGVVEYDMSIAAIPGSKDIEISFDNAKVLQINGIDTTSAAAQEKLLSVTAIANAMPSFRVSREGRLIGVVDLDGMLKKVLSSDVYKAHPEVRARVEALIKTPRMQETLQSKVGDYWRFWVGQWLDVDLEPGAKAEFTRDTPAFGVAIPQAVVIEHLGESSSPGGKQQVHLRLVARADEARMATALKQVMRTVADQQNKEIESLERAERTVTIDLHTDPRSLKPSRVVVEAVTRLHVKGQAAKEALERQDYEFTWFD